MATNDSGNPSNLKVALVALMFTGSVLILFSLWLHSCSVAPVTKTVEGPAPVPSVCIDGAKQDLGCPVGQAGVHTQTCTAGAWVDLGNSCHDVPSQKPACGSVVTFDKLAPLIGLNCVGCHAGFDQLVTAKAKSPEMIRRIQLDPTDPAHMPAQRPSLAGKDIDVFKGWAASGFLAANDCIAGGPVPPQTFMDFTTVEQAMFADANRVSAGDQPNVRYLIAVDQINQGKTSGVATARAAAAKASNSVSTNRTIRPLVNVAPGIWRINIIDLGLNAVLWQTVEAASQLQFESFTQTGIALKVVTKTRLPWMNVADFNDTALHNSVIYYALTKAPSTLQQLEANLGVNFVGDLQNFKASLMAFNGSSLSLAANRLMARFDSNDGDFWLTEDTGKIVSDKQNVFKNPLIAAVGGQANLVFAAGEQLYSLPNGLMASFLADAAGKRLNAADPAVVHDFTTNPISPIIVNAISCFRCHNAGKIHAVDKVRASIAGSGIGADDTQRALALYKPQTTLDALFAGDNQRFANAMAQLSLNPNDPDPISIVSDRFLGDQTLESLAGFLMLRPEELASCINLSAQGKQQAGQLLTGGDLSHDQFVQVVAALLRDCRIFQDPLN